MKQLRALAPWLLVTLAVFAAAWLRQHFTKAPPPPLLAWQKPVAELTASQQQTWREVRAALAGVEDERSRTGEWPRAQLTSGVKWSYARAHLAINYTAEIGELRWLVLYLEPDPRVTETPPPDDDEHHTLADGTALHVTVWTQPVSEPPMDTVTAFPAAEGWVEVILR